MSTESKLEYVSERQRPHDAPISSPPWLEAVYLMLRRNQLRLAVVVVFTYSMLGCGVPTVSELPLSTDQVTAVKMVGEMQPMLPSTPDELSLVSNEVELSGVSSILEDAYAPPYPDRKNPFEFGGEFAAEGAQQEGVTDAANIRLYGFVGDAPAKAIISVGGRTKLLGVGEKWGVIEMLEVDPPQAKIRVDGVTRNWSLLGHSDQAGVQ